MVNVGIKIAGDNPIRNSLAVPVENLTNSVGISNSNEPEKNYGKTTPIEQMDPYKEVVSAVDAVNKMLLVKSTNLVFEFYDKDDPPVVKIVDKENGDIIREIPSKELRDIAKALNHIADTMYSKSSALLNEQL